MSNIVTGQQVNNKIISVFSSCADKPAYTFAGCKEVLTILIITQSSVDRFGLWLVAMIAAILLACAWSKTTDLEQPDKPALKSEPTRLIIEFPHTLSGKYQGYWP